MRRKNMLQPGQRDHRVPSSPMMAGPQGRLLAPRSNSRSSSQETQLDSSFYANNVASISLGMLDGVSWFSLTYDTLA